MAWARIAACLASNDPYASGYREVLEHVGLRPDYDLELVSDIGRLHVLLLCGTGVLKASERELVRNWVAQGGQLVVSGSTWGVNELFEIGVEPVTVSQGVMRPATKDRLWPEDVACCRFFGGVGVSGGSGQALATDGAGKRALSRAVVGEGTVYFVGPHVGQTLILMQMGRSVECDGIGPEDDSVRLDTGKLCAEDGIALPWGDRIDADGTPVFGAASSDVLKEIWLRAVFQAIDRSNQSVAFPWYWPDHADVAASLSLECESGETDGVVAVHRMLAMYGVPTAWTISLPGYGNEVYRTIRARDHEVALLFAVDENHAWQEERFRSQATQLSRLSGEPNIASARALRGAWRGWSRFYEMCEATGIRLSMSKGGRQKGTSGFAFGTCHPYCPVRSDLSSAHVLELPYHVFRPGVVTPDKALELLVAEAVYRSGCLHIVSCPADFAETNASNVLRRLFALVKESRAVWLNPGEIQRFEMGRRRLRWGTKSIAGEMSASIVADQELPGLSILASANLKAPTLNGKLLDFQPIERFGSKFLAVKWDMRAKQTCELKLSSLVAEAA